ncbi:MAG: OadG family protein [Ruminococcus sp.]|nr:OadG family protein [Ruminococcus sp.]
MLNILTLLAAADVDADVEEVIETAEKVKELSVGDAAVTAVFGYAVVFFGLIILMCVLYVTGAIFKSRDAKAKALLEAEKKKEEAAQAKAAPAAAPAPAPEKKLAPGSAGHIKLYNVPDKEAAMIMAIVADTLKKPINELHFISIREVKSK